MAHACRRIAGLPPRTNHFDKGLAHPGLAVLACAQVAVVAGGAVQCRWIGALASGEIACPRNVALIRCRARDWSEDAEAGGGVTGGHRAFVRRLALRRIRDARTCLRVVVNEENAAGGRLHADFAVHISVWGYTARPWSRHKVIRALIRRRNVRWHVVERNGRPDAGY